MGNVFVHTLMSLDGFIAGPNDDMSWVFRHVGDMPGEVVDEVIARAGAVLGGRRVYDVGRRVQQPGKRGLFDGRWSGPIFILTHTPPTDETDPSYIFLSGDVRDAVATALTAADGGDVLLLGANVVDQCLEAGLVDEILMHIVPELVGDGVRLFALSTLRASLTTLDVSASGQIVNLRLRVDKASRDGLRVVTIALRPLHDDDLDDLFRWQNNPMAVRMAAFTRPDSADRAAFDAHYRRVRSDPDNTLLAIEADGVLAGTIGSFTVEGDRELTYWIDPARWGRGIASRAVQTFIGRETQRPLFARTAAHNLGSSKVLLRNGFTQIGEETSWAAGVGQDVLEHIYRLD